MVNRCGDCKYKGKELERTGGFFQCQRIALDFHPAKGAGAVVQDGSDYIGQLCVEDTFGCAAFERKQEGQP